MKRDMDCVGFEASQTLIAYMSSALSEIQHLCPSDSYVDATAQKEEDRFNVTLAINYPDGSFKATTQAVELKDAVNQAFIVIKQQIKEWHRSRFTPN